KEEFYGQFAGLPGGTEITVVKSGAVSDKCEINAITGATITSRAVTKAVNEALDLSKEIKTETEAGSDEKQ
ncbi:MAG: FMN-binding protein, partial [Clostridia bacterium]|nr:FMN-binding protein [Clostridia bacterium]